MAQTDVQSTFFAPAERAPEWAVRKDFEAFRSLTELKEILDALPYIAAILNSQRQIVYLNQALMDMVGAKSVDELLGKRAGEALNCIHAAETQGGCGTSEACRLCGAAQATVHSQLHDEKVTEECRITACKDGTTFSFDLSVTSSPYHHDGVQYTILAIKDIGDEKRRRSLEQIFFHDIINHAQSVTGLLTFAKDVADVNEVDELLGLAHMASMELMDGILSQRDLLAAENGEVRLMKRTLSSRTLLQECVNLISHHFAAHDRVMVVDDASADCAMTTDETLLKRIIINMVKNALEATPVKGTVRVGCEKSGTGVKFWAHNATFIPRHVQLQIFQRSYSTKGANRGLGTYSMKLLGEQLLGGTVSFTTDPESGTTFFFDLSA
jgi:PAS domain-containing protein